MWKTLVSLTVLSCLTLGCSSSGGSSISLSKCVVGFELEKDVGDSTTSAGGAIMDTSFNFYDDDVVATVEAASWAGPETLTFSGLFYYNPSALADVATSESVTFDIQWKGDQLLDTLVMPGGPAITAPTAGTYQDPSAVITVVWGTITPQPDRIKIILDWTDTISEDDETYIFAGSATQGDIPANRLKAKLGVDLRIAAENFTAVAAGAGSEFVVSHGDDLQIHTTP